MMKRALLGILLLLLLSGDLVGQMRYGTKRVWASVGAGGGVSLTSSGSVEGIDLAAQRAMPLAGVELGAGYRLFEQFSLGVGAGLDYCTKVSLLSLPYWLEARWFLSAPTFADKDWFVWGRYGGARLFGVDSGSATVWGAGVGCVVNISGSKIELRVGYGYNKSLFIRHSKANTLTLNTLSLRAGLMF